jgi:vanillate O-demethylase ferredoxin subunit
MAPSTLIVKVQASRREAVDIRSFRLVDPAGGTLPDFTPGSHIDVHLEPGLIRQYSLCNGPGDRDHYAIAVKREPESRGGSAAMHDRVKDGDVISISEPRNNFPLDVSASHTLLIAGGIGITPMLSMARHLSARNAAFDLQYFTRSLEHTAFHDVLSTPRYTGKLHFHYAVEPDAVQHYLRRILWHRPEGGHLYICGPRPFMDLVEQTAAPTWPPESVHLEYFSADPSSLAGPQDEFEVTLARSGGTHWIPEGRTIVEVLAERGVQVEVSCEQGVCGTCLTGVLEGVPDHRDMFLTDEEKTACDKMTVCLSRAKTSRLILDL